MNQPDNIHETIANQEVSRPEPVAVDTPAETTQPSTSMASAWAMVKQSYRGYSQHAKTIVPIGIVVAMVTSALFLVPLVLLYQATFLSGRGLLAGAGMAIVLSVLFGLLSGAISLWFSYAVIKSYVYELDIKQTISQSFVGLWGYVWLMIVILCNALGYVGLWVAGIFAVLGLASAVSGDVETTFQVLAPIGFVLSGLVAFYYMLRVCLAAYIYVNDGLSGSAAVAASWVMVGGRLGAVLWRWVVFLVVFILTIIVASLPIVTVLFLTVGDLVDKISVVLDYEDLMADIANGILGPILSVPLSMLFGLVLYRGLETGEPVVVEQKQIRWVKVFAWLGVVFVVGGVGLMVLGSILGVE